MKNKILFIAILILTMSLSCAYAYSPDDILADLTTLRDRGLMTGIPTNYQNNPAWTYVLQTYNSSGYANHNFTGYFIAKTTSGSYSPNMIFVGMIYNSTLGVTTSIKSNNVASNNSLYYTWSGFNGNTKTYGLTGSQFHIDGSNGSTGSFDYDKMSWDYFYVRDIPINTRTWVQEANTEYGGNYLTDALEFYPYNDEVVSTNVNAIKNIYRFSVVSLGQITNYLDDDRYNYVELLQGNNIVASMTYNNISKRITNSNNMDIESNDNGDIIRVNNWILYLDELYTLNIYSGRRKYK